MKLYGGGRRIYSVRLLYCDTCERYHRELPDKLAPYKHYAARIIRAVIDDTCYEDDDLDEDYPCDATQQRWKDEISTLKTDIDGSLRSVIVRLPGFSEELLKSADSLLHELRKKSTEWLAVINRALYNSGYWQHSLSRRIRELLCFDVPEGDDVSSSLKEEKPSWNQKRYKTGRITLPLNDSS